MTDRQCVLLHSNAFTAATISGGTWLKDVSNLGVPNLYQDVARCVTGTVAGATFVLTWPKAIAVGGLALVGYTGPKGGKVRLTWSRRGVPVGPAAWERIRQRVQRTRDLPYSAANWWSGRGAGDIFFFIPPVGLRADALTVEIDALGAAEFDLSYLFIAPRFRPDWPMAWGRDMDFVGRTRISKTRSGAVIPGPFLRAQRVQTVTFEELSWLETQEWQRIALAHDRVHPLLFMPDPSDGVGWATEAYVSQMVELAGWKQIGPDRYQVVVKIAEMVA
jgi:hypothetical protein